MSENRKDTNSSHEKKQGVSSLFIEKVAAEFLSLRTTKREK